MAFEPKPHTGMLWINDKRTDENNQPHLKGKLNLPQGDFWISAWKSPDKEGKFRLSIATTPIEKAIPGTDIKPKAEAELTPGGLPKIAAEDLPF